MMATNIAALSRRDTLNPEHLAVVRQINSGAWLSDSRVAYVWQGIDGRAQIWSMDVHSGVHTISTLPFVRGDMSDVTDRRDMSGGLQVRPGSTSEVAFLAADPAKPERTAVWTGDVLTGEAQLVTNHPESDRSPRWAPDGSALAYVAVRGGRHHLFVVHADGKGSRQLTYDRFANYEPVFSPDGTQIVYTSKRADEDPFSYSICLVSVTTGQVTRLTHDDTVLDRAPRWSPDGEWILFVSDRDGYDNIWKMRADGSALTQVTSTETDKQDPQWHPDGTTVYFTETKGVTTWVSSVSPESGTPTPATQGNGVAAAPRVSPNGEHLLYAYSDHTSPFELFLNDALDKDVRQLTRIAGSSLQAVVHSEPEVVNVPTPDGQTIECLYYPAVGQSEDPVPAVLYIHGGPNAAVQNLWAPQIQLLAQRGIAVLAPNYRGSLGYGRAWRDGIVGAPAGKGEVLDWLTAREHLGAMDGIDSSRIAAMGRSYGSFATLTLLTIAPEKFVGGVAISGVSDWLEFWEEADTTFMRQLARWFFGSGGSQPDRTLMRSRSPIFDAHRVVAPTLFVHGESDEVAIGQSKRMAAALRANDAEVHEAWYAGEGHVFSGPFALVDSNRRILTFLTGVLCP